jgi:hypothetical protein
MPCPGAARLLAVAVLVLAAGCATPRLVPLPDGVSVDPSRHSTTQTRDGVTVTARVGPWVGSPRDLELYVQPVHVAIRNDTGAGVSITATDIVLLDDEGRQYNPIPPEEVARMLQAAGAYAVPAMVHAPWPYRRWGAWPYFHDPFYDPFFSPWWYPPPRYQPVHDVLGLALQPGVVRQGARLEGFVYFPRPARSARHFELVVGYQVEGVAAPQELRFPFALQRHRA